MSDMVRMLLAKYPCELLANGNVRTCPVRLSYPKLFKPDAFDDGQEPKFSVSLLFPHGADMSVLKAAAQEAVKAKFTADEIKKGVASPFRDQAEKPGEGYVDGAVFVNASSKQKPAIVDARVNPITDESRVYPGVWARVTLRAFAWSNKGKRGVSFGLQNVQIIADDKPLAGRSDARTDFDTVEDVQPQGAADLESMFN